MKFRQQRNYQDTSPPLLPPLKPKKAFGSGGGSSSDEYSPRDYGVESRIGGGGGRRLVQSEQRPNKTKNFFKFGKKFSAPAAILGVGSQRQGVQVINGGRQARRSQDPPPAIEEIEEIAEEDLERETRVDKKRQKLDTNSDGNKQKRKVLPPPAFAEVFGQRKEFLAPTNAEIGRKNAYKPPKKKLKLEWVYPLKRIERPAICYNNKIDGQYE